jgi:hypothetical protein
MRLHLVVATLATGLLLVASGGGARADVVTDAANVAPAPVVSADAVLPILDAVSDVQVVTAIALDAERTAEPVTADFAFGGGVRQFATPPFAMEALSSFVPRTAGGNLGSIEANFELETGAVTPLSPYAIPGFVLLGGLGLIALRRRAMRLA